MKTIELKTIEGVHDGKPLKIVYKAQLIEVMKTPLNGEWASVNEIRSSIRVMEALETATGDTLNLEDADYDHMRQCVLSMRWPIKNKLVIQFTDDVTKQGE